jgi:hypothetical protein
VISKLDLEERYACDVEFFRERNICLALVSTVIAPHKHGKNWYSIAFIDGDREYPQANIRLTADKIAGVQEVLKSFCEEFGIGYKVKI